MDVLSDLNNLREIVMTTVDLGSLSAESFKALVNSVFEVEIKADKTLPLTLVKAETHASPPSKPEGSQPPQPHNFTVPGEYTGPDGAKFKARQGGGFTLEFIDAAAQKWLQQGVYPVCHPKLGTMEILLVPAGPVQPNGHGYHAVFG
jgi:hypothetical protein